MVHEKLEHEVLLALASREIEDYIRNLGRDFGEYFKARNVNVKEFQLHILDLIGEAVEVLKQKTQEKEKKK
jgi:hypothetical protein